MQRDGKFINVLIWVTAGLILLSFVKYFLYFTRILRDARANETREQP